jgi:hypothetical protein
VSEEGEVRRYLTDDRDAPAEERHELVLFPGGNGDWYLGVWPEGARSCANTVRLCTSGGASTAAPGLPLAAARMYRALGPKLAPVKLPEVNEGCYHALILPLGNGYGRCQACGDDSFPITPMAAGECQCCGETGGNHTTICNDEPRMEWAVARHALEELERVYGGIVPSTLDSTVRALRRIMYEIVDVHLPGTSIAVTYDGAKAVKARWKGIGQQATVKASLMLLGLELMEPVLVVIAGGEENAVIEAAVRSTLKE